MDKYNVNRFILGLSSSLEFEPGNILWINLLKYIVTATNALYAKISFSNPDHEVFVGGAGGALIGSVCWQLPAIGCAIELGFSEEDDKNKAMFYWSEMSQSIKEIFNLGFRWQENNENHKIFNSSCENTKMGVIQIDELGGCEGGGPVVEFLKLAGVLRKSTKEIQLSLDPDWIFDMQNKMMKTNEHYQSAYKVVRVKDASYRCVLLYQRHMYSGWKMKVHQFTLLVHLQEEYKGGNHLKAMFDISEPEAEVASWYSKGLTAEEVSNITGYTVNTVYSYIKSLYSFLEVNKQSQLTATIWPELPI
jgi:DNA-binding CsgD family transcriptional regulator